MLKRVASKWSSLPKWMKWAIIAGAVVVVTGTYTALISVKPFFQGDKRWGGDPLGKGTLTISRAGCLLTSLTRAVNSLLGQSLTPGDVNKILQGRDNAWAPASSGMNRSNMVLDNAVPAVGLRIVERLRNSFHKVSDIKRVVDQALQAGNVAIVHMTKDGDASGDHFVLVNGHNAQGYVITDPSYGKALQLDHNLSGKVGSKGVMYQPVGVAHLASSVVKKA